MSPASSAPFDAAAVPRAKVDEVHILWINQLLSWDRDSGSATAASLPSLEEVLGLGADPRLPKVHLHNPVLCCEVGDELMDCRSRVSCCCACRPMWRRAERCTGASGRACSAPPPSWPRCASRACRA